VAEINVRKNNAVTAKTAGVEKKLDKPAPSGEKLKVKKSEKVETKARK
jgi:hypothetical protein